ncbi:TPA: PD-(D/E)XK nuclease family protein, partial [Campylobacter jejuni]|nr:PD-(D/E)XK nuclease family protein [Campylobacter jejuni]HEF2288503.1 PD-(D/E)XK nuclease family protein [Campylobacter jejuni]
MEKFIERLLEEDIKFEKDVNNGLSDINIFDALNIETKENYHSKFIAYLIDINKDHYQKNFAKVFLEKLGKSLVNTKFENLNIEDIKSVETEACIKDNRRIDILITLSDKRYIIIENKIYAKDQKNQLKDYINFVRKNIKNIKDCYKNILTIYLHQDECASPSDYSLGNFTIKTNLIKDKNENNVSYYLKMDYIWIKEWIDECIKIYEEKSTKDQKFILDIQNIIFTLNQYKSILQWYMTDEYTQRDDVLEFIFQNNIKMQNLKNAMILYRYNKNKSELKNLNEENYKKAKDIIQHKWSNICEYIIEEFFDSFEHKEIKIGDITFIGNKIEENRVNHGVFIFYPIDYKNESIYPCIYIYFKKKYYDIIGLTFEISNDDEEDIENEKYKECLKLFKDVKEENVRKYQNHYYCDKLINNEKLEGEYAFIYWLIENQNSKKDFIQILNDFFIKKPIQEA